MNDKNCLVLLLFFAVNAVSAESYSPIENKKFPSNVYWGDTHLHTNLSVDAYFNGNKSLTPEDAYRFAMGETVTAHNGLQARLSRPLDFLVIADHGFNLGLSNSLYSDDEALFNTPSGKRLYDKFKASANKDVAKHQEFLFEQTYLKNPVSEKAYSQSVWHRVASVADRYNQAGKFTAFIGYEWTSLGYGYQSTLSNMGNLHRVVIFKDSAETVTKITPFTRFDSNNPEDLWRFMDAYEKNTNGEVLAIPHNGNLSKGEMFSTKNFIGQPLIASYAKTRSRWEPLYEVTQVKGDGESHPLLSPQDEFADYETWDNWSGKTDILNEEQKGWKKYEYARSGLKQGIQWQGKLGVNPFKFGMIGSTDSHTSLSTADDSNFWGKWTSSEPKPSRILGKGWNQSYAAAGYAAVWAEENTRESLFAAMKRKEVYATTGPRIRVRFFGGWEYQEGDAFSPDIAGIGYKKGVPMGGDLINGPKGKPPSFLIRAVKDPDGANLDRIQVVKGWIDSSGELYEKIYDAALSDHRKARWNSKVKPVGSTVNVKEASYTNTIGDPELAVTWKDPDFNGEELAFYYVRVLEIPTPRWTAYDAKYFNVEDIPEALLLVTQERVYTSPIWYIP